MMDHNEPFEPRLMLLVGTQIVIRKPVKNGNGRQRFVGDAPNRLGVP